MSEREDNCTGGGRLPFGSLFLPPSVEQPERHIRIAVSSQAGDRIQDLNGYNHREQRRLDKRDAD